jgi:hypothetical protein
MDNDMFAHYRAVLAHEQAERERLLAELRLKDSIIAGLQATLAAHEPGARAWSKPLPFNPPVALPPMGPAEPTVPPHLRFAGISVRWALLSLMAEDPSAASGLRTTEMADALLAGGVRSSGQNFAANVSAVVSDMTRKKKELEAVEDGKYVISAHGREVWDGVKRNRYYRYRRLTPAPDIAPASSGEEG